MMARLSLAQQGLGGFLGVFSDESSDVSSFHMVLQRLLENPSYFKDINQAERKVIKKAVRKGVALLGKIKENEGLDEEFREKAGDLESIAKDLLKWVEDKKSMPSERVEDIERLKDFIKQLSQAHLNLAYKYSKAGYIEELKRV